MRTHTFFGMAWRLALAGSFGAAAFATEAPASGKVPPSLQSASTQTGGVPRSSPQAWFAEGQTALQKGDLDAAETAFRRVLAADPASGAAYSNLGVIAMRRKEWDRAITLLRKAEKLEPKLKNGIQLNIGLVEYRRGNYGAAISPLTSVLHEQPDSEQARHLLGLCQVLSKHYSQAVRVLEPLWQEKANDVPYLYLLDIAAVESGQKELDEKILKQMIAVGGQTAEYHLILGKAFLNRDEIPEAKAELERAAALNPHLPFLHLDLGIVYMRSGENERAEAEFRKDVELEPDVADNYEQLGVLYSRMQREEEAEKSFRESLKRNGKSDGAYLDLAKLYQKQQRLPAALKMVDAALRLAPEIQSAHFLRGRILTQLGREKEAQAELAAAQKSMDAQLNKERRAREENKVPNPELTREPQ